MTDLKIFKNEEFGEVRVVEVNGEPWFVGKDVAGILGYARPLNALATHIDEDDSLKRGLTDSMGRMQETILINESGLYSLILSSKLPNAKKFKRWVTNEVLPSIRKHGAYMTPEKLREVILNPEIMIQVCTALMEEQEKNKQLTLENRVMKPKADYFDELVDRNLLTSFRETAKEFKIKERELIKFLMEKGYIFRNKRGSLLPYANTNDGLFEVKEFFNDKTGFSGTQTLFTPKGREVFRLLLKTIA